MDHLGLEQADDGLRQSIDRQVPPGGPTRQCNDTQSIVRGVRPSERLSHSHSRTRRRHGRSLAQFAHLTLERLDLLLLRARRPWSRSTCRTQWRSLSPEQPILAAMDRIASSCEVYSSQCSKTIRTARSRTSGE
jgi:hypothetical protein